MFYTVTLPATLWFFDKAKSDDRILFIDARNIFTRIDRTHREFSAEQIKNIAVIGHLHKGDSKSFVQLVEVYFASGMERLIESQTRVEPLSAQLLSVLDDKAGEQAVAELVDHWSGLADLRLHYQRYRNAHSSESTVHRQNKAQHELREVFDPFFAALHEGLKRLDKLVRKHEKGLADKAHSVGKRGATDRQTKELKGTLMALHGEVRDAESFYQHIHWLHERFPEAAYEDITGLCKVASIEELKEQEYSLNPGRYVGVVIEEDGKTEEEFIEGVLDLDLQLSLLNREAANLVNIITANVKRIAGAE